MPTSICRLIRSSGAASKRACVSAMPSMAKAWSRFSLSVTKLMPMPSAPARKAQRYIEFLHALLESIGVERAGAFGQHVGHHGGDARLPAPARSPRRRANRRARQSSARCCRKPATPRCREALTMRSTGNTALRGRGRAARAKNASTTSTSAQPSPLRGGCRRRATGGGRADALTWAAARRPPSGSHSLATSPARGEGSNLSATITQPPPAAANQ